MRHRLGHTPSRTARAEPPSLAREGDNSAVAAVAAANAQEAVRRDAATKVRVDLVKHEGGQIAAADFHVGQELRPMLLQSPVEECLFRSVAFVRTCARDRGRVTARCRRQEGPQQGLSDARLASCESPFTNARPAVCSAA